MSIFEVENSSVLQGSSSHYNEIPSSIILNLKKGIWKQTLQQAKMVKSNLKNASVATDIILVKYLVYDTQRSFVVLWRNSFSGRSLKAFLALKNQ